eukprot:TRINITY_DN621_c0_g1_i4.p1 TRINITY_DN621_c0_g1~~TRINITY_DN621_c0_g1_i4.p1  ORF type:complete len:835 (+),score=330.60 TRINITY_DN621_c0_g1_i4:105-2609(+)
MPQPNKQNQNKQLNQQNQNKQNQNKQLNQNKQNQNKQNQNKQNQNEQNQNQNQKQNKQLNQDAAKKDQIDKNTNNQNQKKNLKRKNKQKELKKNIEKLKKEGEQFANGISKVMNEVEDSSATTEDYENLNLNEFQEFADQANLNNENDNNDKINEQAEFDKDEIVDNQQKAIFSKFIQAQSHPDNLYDSESSDAEAGKEISKTGNIPMHWYDGFDHIGYNLDGEQVKKTIKRDEIDKFLFNNDPSGIQWRTVYDEKSGKEIILTEQEYEMLRRINEGKFADGDYDPYEPMFERPYEDKIHPITGGTEPKSRFIPSKWEAKRIAKLVTAYKKGWIKLNEKSKKPLKHKPYMIWKDGEESEAKYKFAFLRIPPPKPRLPVHAESYNPPSEYLLTQQEYNTILKYDPNLEKNKFLPTKYNSMRDIPIYEKLIRERFERCLDLYLCPRAPAKIKKQVELAEKKKKLLPDLPKPETLRPYPTTLAVQYRGHKEAVQTISVSSKGQFLASGSSDGVLIIWEVETGRLLKQWNFGSSILVVAFNPNHDMHDILVVTTADARVLLINIYVRKNQINKFDERIAIIDQLITYKQAETSSRVSAAAMWSAVSDKELYQSGVRMQITLKKAAEKLIWHNKGDYFACVCPDASQSNQILIHRITTQQTQFPFRKLKGKVQCVQFHPSSPHFFVATQRIVRIYNLVKQVLMKKLLPPVDEISSIDIHPGGDNILVGSFDNVVCWFDLELGAGKPYKILKYHRDVVRSVTYHRKYPLFASCSDDGRIHIFHGMVYNDLLKNALIVPVNVLSKYHKIINSKGILDCVFHPNHPWIFSCGADGLINLFSS